MAKTLAARWTQVNERFVTASGLAADVVGGYGSFSKIGRLLLQSAILGLGAYLVIRQELTAGSMIAASIMMGRALAPIETAIANWRGFISARVSIRRLSETLARSYVKPSGIDLPPPAKLLDVDLPAVAAPGADKLIVKDVRFRLAAGEVLGVIGPSGVGKTSLVRNIVGIWPPVRGTIRLDGATLSQWDPERLGPHIGFVSQGVELFEGTIAENIARMAVKPDSAAVLEAGQAAGAHDMILQFSNGYDTRIGEAGTILSAGQRQRIALARALYGNPFLLVLDEPNSNLDNDGEAALLRAIQNAKARNAIVILIAHRPSMLSVCDKVLFLANGMQQAFGPRDEVLSKVLARPAPAAASAGLKVVGDTTGGAKR
jgi:PrtD family type I secretion system ABC transporter